MHVFIDTNILLSFFHFTSDELDTLNNVFASHEQGTATVYLTEQVSNEFKRNRETKIRDALKRFNELKPTPQLPAFMREYKEYGEIRDLSNTLQGKVKDISSKAIKDIRRKELPADHLIGDIFERFGITETSDQIYERARKRMDLGNPPGKAGSIGDAINWTILLEVVPNKETIHIISEDGDFYSPLDEKVIDPFLEEEWQKRKGSSIRIYRTLGEFIQEHFDGVQLTFDEDKRALIEALASSGNFAATHSLVASLDSYGYFSLDEGRAIINAVEYNSQVGGILADRDVADFLTKALIPHRASLNTPTQQEIIKTLLEE